MLRDETVVRIANSVTGTTDSIVTPSGDRLGVKAGGTVSWFIPDLHGDIAGSLRQDGLEVPGPLDVSRTNFGRRSTT